MAYDYNWLHVTLLGIYLFFVYCQTSRICNKDYNGDSVNIVWMNEWKIQKRKYISDGSLLVGVVFGFEFDMYGRIKLVWRCFPEHWFYWLATRDNLDTYIRGWGE